MAKDKNPAPQSAPAAVDFDYDSLIPAELRGKGTLEKVGGLTPLYRHEQAWDERFPPIAGYPINVEQLPVDDFDAMVIRYRLTSPTKGCLGKQGDITTVDCAAGTDILVPVNGNLRNNRPLLMAAMDRKSYFFSTLRPLGPKRVNKKPSEMWDYDVRVMQDVPLPRAGTAFEFRTADVPLLAETSTGDVYDMRTGEVVSGPKKMKAAAESASA